MTARPSGSTQIEWPTVALIWAVYMAWGISTTWLAAVSLPLGIIATGLVIAQYSSVQHEVMHGHPFPSQRLNEALVFPGFALCVPYIRFRDTHLAHHRDEMLTDPYDDPESNYLDPAVWHSLPAGWRAVLRANNTLLGRMILGPMVSIVCSVIADLRAVKAGNRVVRAAWLWHVPGMAMVFFWLWATGAMPVWAYLAAAYAGFGLLKIRTFLEHRAHERASGRTVVVEDRGLLALLFLNNNYHVVHHMHPRVAWYRLPALYFDNRARYLTRNGGYVFRNYAEVFRRYFLVAKDPVPHPLWPDERPQEQASGLPAVTPQ